MGRLSGFKYKEIAKRLRSHGFEFYREARVAMRFGTVKQSTATLPFRAIAATCLRELSELY